jgi:RNA polymerase sigma-70 factor, ECF subfamily
MTDELPVSETGSDNDDLVARAGTDRAALGVLYDRYYPRVARYCRRRLFDRATAEDVTSEVFLKVASNLATFRGSTETDFRRWLFRIATNSVNAHLRQSRRRQELRELAARSRVTSAGAGHSSQGSSENLDWPAVYQAVLALDEREQTIITLRFFAGCTHEEIADVVDSTPGAVRTALSRTLTTLRNQFNPSHPAPNAIGRFPQG